MKRRNIFFVALALICGGLIHNAEVVANAEEQDTHSIQVHYHRADGDYSSWDLWIWSKNPNGNGQAKQYKNTDYFGGYTDPILLTDLTGTSTKSTEVGLIYRKPDWSKQSGDIIVSVPEKSKDGIFHAYLIDGANEALLVAPEEGQISTANMTATNVVKAKVFLGTTPITEDNIRVLEEGIEKTITSVETNREKEEITITLGSNVDLAKALVLELTIGDNTFTSPIGTAGLYDTPEFIEAFTYEGDDLGAIVSADDSKTTFKLWAPTSTVVKLNLYNTGTPAQNGGTDTPIATHDMVKGEKGVWSYEINEDLHGTYYTYTVTNSGGTNETIDPYAKGCGVNGIRGLVVDFERVNPTGWEYGKRANSIEKRSDANIYELHVRDYTKDETWGGPAEYSGKFLGLAQTGTYYEDYGIKYSTGLDHLKELGVTNIQILPFYDQATVDEAAREPSYNWGYDPLNYNCLEGSYSTDPFDGFVRIREFKTMMMALTEAGIRVNMDVVYNHTARSSNSNFNFVIPGYYHRMTADGGFSNGSGCGNEVASQRPMVRKFIKDSTKFLYTEYNLSGYRFDLMELVDKQTMLEVYQQLREIDPLTLVYGEPWTGGASALPSGEGANKATVKYLVTKDELENITGGVGYFNDDTRDGIVGRVPSPETPGWVQVDKNTYTGATYYNGIRFGITGGTGMKYANGSNYVYDATQTINYVSCHDNNTLWDKLRLSTSKNSWKYDEEWSMVREMNKQADTVVFFAQGIPFIQEGQEFLRSKPKEPGVGSGTIYDHNSYCSPDSVNKIRWNLKAENNDVYEYYKDLYAFRNAHEAFKLSSAQEISSKLAFIEDNNSKNKTGVMYRLQVENDNYKDMIIIHNVAEFATFALPEGNWKVVFDHNGLTDGSKIVTGEIQLEFNQSVVLANVDAITEVPSETPTSGGCGKASVGVVTIFAVIALAGAVLLKRKETLGA